MVSSTGKGQNEDRKTTNRQAYGEHLKRLREAKGLTQAELGRLIAMSASMVAHMEAGRRIPQLKDAELLDKVLDADGFFVRFLDTLGVVPVADHFAAALEAEQHAIAISEYAVSLVPGLLQTPAYARAVYQAQQPNYVPADVDRRVVNRMKRAEIMKDPLTPTLWFILNENVIRAQVGGPAVMAEQLRHIASLGRSGRVRAQIVPHSSGAHATMGSMLSLMRFADAPELAYVEALYTGNLIDDPLMVQKCKDAYDLARAAAMPPDASLDLLEEVAEDYT
ncbi:helix-turn-helix DNA binding domain protein [Streptomyces phage Success]|uniref:Helix-turn-helix DNA binding domain protein n=1 Tax=Streptomyces phage Success TaxID=2999013 RepID=A0A9E8S191_9CAUD|nr:helix-turn-helix DNA binding domain protein [Streptomyces phage Success]WAB08793.1 helix-turn-helix DNA binding domain protein [Streptomyces phage Success]